MTYSRDAAWDAVHEAVPARWAVGQPSYDPGVLRPDGYRGAWSVTARGATGRGKVPQTVTGTGKDATAALRDLNDRLRGSPRPDGTRLDAMRRRLRLAYVEGPEEWTAAKVGRRMTTGELGRVIGRYGSTIRDR